MSHGYHQWLAGVAQAFFVTATVWSPAFAGDASDGARPAEPASLQEVVVTAQKRSEAVQRVPISVQVIEGAALVQQNNNSLENLTETVPAVHIASGAYSDNLFVRGIGSGASNPSYDQSVAVFTDDIYHGRSRLSEATFLDVDRIEILKGAQSTYFGNNAIAGALNIVTKKPGTQLDASGRLLYGEYGQYAADAAIGGPITDELGARLALTRNGDRDGWIENTDLRQRVPRVNNFAGRLTLTYQPLDNLDVTLKGEGSDHRTAGSFGDQPMQLINCPPPSPISPTYSGTCSQALTLGLPRGLDTNETTGLPGQRNNLTSGEAVLTVNLHAWEHTFTSVTGFNEYNFTANEDDGLLPTFVYKTAQPVEKYRQFSQELRVASPTGDTFEYLFGAYFQTDRLEEATTVDAPFLSAIGGHLGVPAGDLPLSFQPSFLQDEHVYSVFGSLAWNVTSALKINAGIRGSDVTKNFTGALQYGTSSSLYGGFSSIPPTVEALWSPLEGAPGTQNQIKSDRAWMPSGGIQYQLTPNVMAYGTYTRGFKAGGFDGLLPLLSASDLEFGPEFVDDFELGGKSTLFDGRLRLNMTLFRMNYSGLQENTILHQAASNTNIPIVRNAAQARSEGVEFEARWVVSRDFDLSTNITYLHARYLSYTDATGTTLQQFCASSYVLPSCSVFPRAVPLTADLSGQPTPESPRWSGSVSANYHVPLPYSYLGTIALLPYVTSGYSAANGDSTDPLFHIGGYLRLDGRLSVEPANGHWVLDVIGKNLTNRVIPTFVGAADASIYVGSADMPRSIAVQLRGKL